MCVYFYKKVIVFTKQLFKHILILFLTIIITPTSDNPFSASSVIPLYYGLLSVLCSGDLGREDSADEAAFESPLSSERAALQSQSVVRLGPPSGVYRELGVWAYCPECWRMEVGGQRELP